MSLPDEIKAAWERVDAGTANEGDRSVLRAAVDSGLLVTGERAVAIGGNASDVIIVTGDGNAVYPIKGTDPASIKAALNLIAPTRLHELPSPPRDFTGRREELTELTTGIEQGVVTIACLQGMGGLGKTAMALKLAEQLTPNYPDAQFYLDLKGVSPQPLSVAEALAHVIRGYHPAVRLSYSEAELSGLYQSLLRGQRVLLLMDNAAGAEQIEPLIPPTGCLLLVTSRQHFAVPGLFPKQLDTLLPAEARNLLLAIAPRIGEEAHHVARLCGYLPLALRLAASALARFVNIKPADYSQRLSDKQQRLKLIEASLSLSYELLDQELQTLWRALAVFPDTFDEAAAAAVWQMQTDTTQDRLSELCAYSLLEWNETNSRYHLHDLARLFAGFRLSDAEHATHERRHAAHYLDVLTAANDQYERGGDEIKKALTSYDSDRDNIYAGQTWAENHAVDEPAAASLCSRYSLSGTHLSELRQLPSERIGRLEKARAAAQQMSDRRAEARHLNDLALAIGSLGETNAAIAYANQALQITREVQDHQAQIEALGLLGELYFGHGEYNNAIEFHQQALNLAREINDRRSEGTALDNLGLTYAIVHEPVRARDLYQEALSVFKEIGDLRGESATLENLGYVHLNAGDHLTAIECFQRQLAIARDIGDRQRERFALEAMQQAYRLQQDPESPSK